MEISCISKEDTIVKLSDIAVGSVFRYPLSHGRVYMKVSFGHNKYGCVDLEQGNVLENMCTNDLWVKKVKAKMQIYIN